MFSCGQQGAGESAGVFLPAETGNEKWRWWMSVWDSYRRIRER